MPFQSQAWSSETLERGLSLAQNLDMSAMADPDPEAMKAELARLEVL